MAQVFISYSRKDREYADRLDADLHNSRLQVWMDRNSIEGGELWKDAIFKGLSDSIAEIVLVSTNSLKSPAVLDEIKIALAMGKIVIPLIIEKLDELPSKLKELGLDANQAIDFAELGLGYEKGYSKPIKALDFWTYPENLKNDLLPYVSPPTRLRTLDELAKNVDAFTNQLILSTLLEILRIETDRNIAIYMTNLVGRFNSPWAIEILLTTYPIILRRMAATRPPSSDDVFFLVTIISQLGIIGNDDARVRNLLEECLNDSQEVLRKTAYETLESFGSSSPVLTIKPLAEMLKHENGNTRAIAANYLGRLGDPRAIPFLLPLLTKPDENDSVKNQIRKSLELLNYESEQIPPES
jgi:hypothetical protein